MTTRPRPSIANVPGAGMPATGPGPGGSRSPTSMSRRPPPVLRLKGSPIAAKTPAPAKPVLAQYGMGEAFLPILEALGRLCRDPDGARLIALLRQHAPSWLVQMPALLPRAEREALQRQASGVTRARMLRELAEAMERDRRAAAGPGAGGSPLERRLDPRVARVRRAPAGSSTAARAGDASTGGNARPSASVVRDHPGAPAARALSRPGAADLPPDAVALYLARRFVGTSLPDELAPLIHRRTSGHPLFMVSLVDDMVREGLGRGSGVDREGSGEPAPADRDPAHPCRARGLHALEAASVAGGEWSAAIVAAASDRDVDAVEERCGAFARDHLFLQPRGRRNGPMARWRPAMAFGTRSTSRCSTNACRRASRPDAPTDRRAVRGGSGAAGPEIAAELAMHFARGHDARRAVQYHHHAGENALRRGAHPEAVAHLDHGLACSDRCPAVSSVSDWSSHSSTPSG